MIRKPVKTPQPPYYSVTTTATLGPTHDARRHTDLGLALYTKAQEIEGFLGWEVTMEKDFSIAVTYWRSLEAIEIWRQHPGHGGAKQLGRQWFSHCMTRIARVERDYGFDNTQTPIA